MRTEVWGNLYSQIELDSSYFAKTIEVNGCDTFGTIGSQARQGELPCLENDGWNDNSAPDTLLHVRLVPAHLMTSATLHANLFI